MKVGENNRQPTRLRFVNVTCFIKYCLLCRFFFLFSFFVFFFVLNFLTFMFHNLLYESATTTAAR